MKQKDFLGRRAITATALGAAFMLVLAGCSAGETGQTVSAPFTGEYTGPEVELSYWNGFTGGDGPFMETMVSEFNAEHDNIKVVSNTMQWVDFYQRLPAAVTAGEGPDVGVMHLDQLATNAARNVIVPIDDLAEELGLTSDDFTEEVWDAGVYKDARYGIPLDVHSLAMYYNTEHFAAAGITEAPTDAASFQDALDKLQAAGFETPFWMPTRWPSHLMNLSLLWQNGGEPYGDDGATFDSAAGVEALEWQRSMVDDGYSPSDVAIDSQYVAFKNGETSITWDGIWQINDLAQSGLPYAVAPIPTIGETDAVWANSHNFFLPRQSTADQNKVDASKVFIAWMSEQSAEWAGSGMIPARQSVRDAGALEGLPQEVIAGTIDSMRFLPPIPGIGGVQAETLEIAVADGVQGATTPSEALKKAADSATQLMDDNKASFGG
ncbi:ABC transporter substrate-binding protein [Cryobacterium suzukii]|uniref:ABC transporter substrate-binding protein n=1 Tax=Cryobacterium suzukii TaxID=1259198 RepID=A0A4R9AFZ4_9MICO|nr:ABC transporter substrate-binding protein [Cryobacterium suzukii]TFD60886.1 ABC transporter substrate-binding protein [Cryobacterium suzukii]